MSSQPVDFSLPNVATGPDPFSLSALSDDVDLVVLYFQRDHYCTNCRDQVQTLADRVEAFHERDAEVSDAYDQPVRFGLLGKLSDFFGRMPEVVVVDRRSDEPEIEWSYEGSSTFDRPDVDEVLAALDELRGTA